jgi:hypothetical protein
MRVSSSWRFSSLRFRPCILLIMEPRESSVASGEAFLEAALVAAVNDVVRLLEECSMTRWAFLKLRRESSYGMRRRG